MPHRVVLKIAAPMIGMGVFLLGLGIFAAWNVHQQQQTSSELVAREVQGMLAIDELHLVMRETRYQVNMFLRTREPDHLTTVAGLHQEADVYLQRAKSYARTEREQELIGIVDSGYGEFFTEFQALSTELFSDNPAAATASEGDLPLRTMTVSAPQAVALTRLSDDLLTNRVLQPLRECMAVNQQVVQRTNEASRETAQHLKIGFVLLGLCGAAAGLLMGTAIARAVGRSIVQFNVSVRGMERRLSDVTGPVTFSHTGDLAGIESGLRTLERDIAQVVERLQQRETEVLRTEQLARVGQLAAGLAHELRNPLMPMKMLVQAALERGADAEGLRGRSLQVLNEEIARLEKAIQAFLDFARPQAPEKATADLKDVVVSTLDLVSARARQQQVEIRPFVPDQPVVIRIDRTQIRQLLLNLLLNAMDALAGPGQIEILLEPNAPGPSDNVPQLPPAPQKVWTERNDMTEHDALRLVYAASPSQNARPARWIALRIADSGPGIPQEMLPTIFEPFVTTKESGTGLGLSICQRIAAAHGGSLTVRNRPLGGAEFTLLLPCGGEHSAA